MGEGEAGYLRKMFNLGAQSAMPSLARSDTAIASWLYFVEGASTEDLKAAARLLATLR